MPRCCALPREFITNKQHVKDVGVMSDFVYWCRHLLVPAGYSDPFPLVLQYDES